MEKLFTKNLISVEQIQAFLAEWSSQSQKCKKIKTLQKMMIRTLGLAKKLV